MLGGIGRVSKQHVISVACKILLFPFIVKQSGKVRSCVEVLLIPNASLGRNDARTVRLGVYGLGLVVGAGVFVDEERVALIASKK